MLKKLLIALLLIGVLPAVGLYYLIAVQAVVPADWDAEQAIEIPSGATYEQVLDTLNNQGIHPNRQLFDPLAKCMAFKRERMRSGRCQLQAGMSYLGLIRHLRSGAQMTVDVVLTTEREPMNVAAKAARFLEPDSLDFVRLFQNEAFLDSIGYSQQTLQTLFIPNTYELYWNSSPRDFVARMVKEHERFWNTNNRRQRAEAKGMSPSEVYTLASIVEKESLDPSEQSRIAGLYLNRLEQGMLLQADPTVVFAVRQFDLGRVLNKHLEYDSPYNTYKYAGLPPGPITMASPGSIDGVLEPEQHDYLYMCSRGDGTEKHNFAKSIAGHGRNIAIYVANLKRRGIR